MAVSKRENHYELVLSSVAAACVGSFDLYSAEECGLKYGGYNVLYKLRVVQNVGQLQYGESSSHLFLEGLIYSM
ncbi:hypothetical protein V7128_28940 [Neobacillus vireti]|uniref:hypothetical protein n=1 Tax=Neobacillus vireti TaxID=220686 RepID=UPI002FFF1C7D